MRSEDDDQIKITVHKRTAGWMNDENLNLNWIKFAFVKLSSGITAAHRPHPEYSQIQ